MDRKVIIAFDLASKTGIAWYWRSIGDFDIWCEELSLSSDIGELACQFEAWFEQKDNEAQIDAIYAEALVPTTKTTQAVLLRSIGLHVLLRMLCHRHNIPLHFVNCATWRKHFIGASKGPKELSKHMRRGWLKGAVFEECLRRGWNPKTDNESDALGILSYAMEQENAAGAGVQKRARAPAQANSRDASPSNSSARYSNLRRNSSPARSQPKKRLRRLGARSAAA